MQSALANMDGVTPVEAQLINALKARYPQRDPIEDQSDWDKDFTKAMREVFEANRDDLEVRTVFAEAIMNETPWKMWDLATGEVAEDAKTAEAIEVLESAFDKYSGILGSSRAAAPLRPSHGDVTLPAAGVASR